jgi:predicted DNA binding CopG/RHH family protein
MTKKTVTTRSTIQARLTSDEFDIIKNKADALGLTTSQYMRTVCLNGVMDENTKRQAKSIKLPRINNRDKLRQMRVTAEEYIAINKRAKDIGLSLSKFLRLSCKYAEINIEIKLPMQSDLTKGE